MSVLNIFLGLFFMIVLYCSLHLLLNRGKVEIKYLIFIVLYSLIIGIPVAYFNYFPERFNLLFYIAYYTVTLTPNLYFHLRNCIKRRQSWISFFFLLLGLVFILITPGIKHHLKIYSIGLGFVFFYRLFCIFIPLSSLEPHVVG
jgi:hypothetical protein